MMALACALRVPRLGDPGSARARPSLHRISAAEIKSAVSRRYSLHPSTMNSPVRDQILSKPRQIAMYLTVELTQLSLQQIGASFGGRHHATVIYAVQCVERLIRQNPDIRHAVDELRAELSQEQSS